MRVRQSLNINNTFHSLNFNTYLAREQHVLHSNNKEELAKIKSLIRAGAECSPYTFEIEDKQPLSLIKDSLEAGAYVKYYLKDTLPIGVIFGIGNNRKFEVVYPYNDNFSKAILDNMDRARQVFRVGIYYHFNFPEDDFKTFLFSMNDVRFIAERVYIDFTLDNIQPYQDNYYHKINGYYDLDPKYKLDLFKKIHEILARWHIQIHLSNASLAEQVDLEQLVSGWNKAGANYG